MAFASSAVPLRSRPTGRLHLRRSMWPSQVLPALCVVGAALLTPGTLQFCKNHRAVVHHRQEPVEVVRLVTGPRQAAPTLVFRTADGTEWDAPWHLAPHALVGTPLRASFDEDRLRLVVMPMRPPVHPGVPLAWALLAGMVAVHVWRLRRHGLVARWGQPTDGTVVDVREGGVVVALDGPDGTPLQGPVVNVRVGGDGAFLRLELGERTEVLWQRHHGGHAMLASLCWFTRGT